ncbi:glycoside hydrolase family 13 protein [Aulographum hederae CBS 113979]|uniref:Glycoside hydrolase family 13 protein n=1 Tax=Aulographum hederae CBS 113979 TaxID=1176131 RepID=A0A6G1HA52_9PEZI|nr:glycoside hydrolase family 13 protein [Aulographum hederae CBS 113979]
MAIHAEGTYTNGTLSPRLRPGSRGNPAGNGENAQNGHEQVANVEEQTTSPADDGNPVLFEAFEWNIPTDHKHWQRLTKALPNLKRIGIDNLWLPPGSKAKDADSNGYDIYDAYDLGEFDQKGTVPTKWGTKDDLVALAKGCTENGMGLVWDAIHNHRAFADATETVKVVEVNPRDRREDITKPFEIVAWSKFNFDARKGKYSTFQYDKTHFNGTDWDQRTEKRSIYRFVEDGKDWAPDVGKLQGNADYLMLENLDYSNEELKQEVNQWGKWITEELDLKGFRLDAIQHYSWNFANNWSQRLKKTVKNDLFFVGEFWHGDVKVLHEWLDNMNPEFMLYDVPLMYNLHKVSWFKEGFTLQDAFRECLVVTRPKQAVTFIQIHDTQKGQAMDTPISTSFTPHAHALILLRRDGHPCVFFGDLYGLGAPFPLPPSCAGKLPGLLLARKLFAYGPQADYFDGRKDTVGWVRHGTPEHPDGCAVVMHWADGEDEETEVLRQGPRVKMDVGRKHAGETWADVLGFEWREVTVGEDGCAEFMCQGNGMACFVRKEASGTERFPVSFDSDFAGLLE